MSPQYASLVAFPLALCHEISEKLDVTRTNELQERSAVVADQERSGRAQGGAVRNLPRCNDCAALLIWADENTKNRPRAKTQRRKDIFREDGLRSARYCQDE